MVRMHVPEPGNEKFRLPVNAGCLTGDFESGTDRRDPVTLNQYAIVRLVRPASDVNNGDAGDRFRRPDSA